MKTIITAKRKATVPKLVPNHPQIISSGSKDLMQISSISHRIVNFITKTTRISYACDRALRATGGVAIPCHFGYREIC